MILEIGKSYVERFYNGNLNAAVKAEDGTLWTDERIKAAFNFGNGRKSDLKKYMENNRSLAYFVKVKVNPMCENCGKYGGECYDTTEKVWTGCVYKTPKN